MALRFLNNGYFAGKVGIGTDSPNAKLEVNSSITFSSIDTFGQLVVKAASGSTGDMLNIGVDTANSVAFIQAVERGVNTIPLSLQRYGGNVGIGTITPDSKLDVTGGDITVNTSGVGFMNFKYGSVGSEATMGSIQTTGIDLKINATSDLLLLPGSNVGIGTTGPGALLQVGDAPTSSSQQGARIYGYDGALSLYTTRSESNFNTALYLYNDPTGSAVGTGTGIMFRANSDTTSGQQQATAYSSWTTNTHASRTAKLVFQTCNAGTVSDKMTILGNGNVGIGTTSPGEKLEVKGDIVINSQSISSATTELDQLIFRKLHPNGASSGFYNQASIRSKTFGGYSGGLNFYTNKSLGAGSYGERLAMSIDNVQNVGIGVTSPASKFEVYGGNSGVNDVDRYVRFKASNGEKRFDFYVGGTGNASSLGMYTSDGTTKNVQIASGGTSYFNGGNVGIGTGSPGQLLHLNDGSTATTTDANNMLLITRDNHSYIMFSCPDNKDSGIHFHNTTDNSFVGRIAYSHEGSSDNMLFTVSGGIRMNISHNGSIRFDDYGAGVLVTDASGNITATTSPPVDGITFNNGATINNQIDTDVDTGSTTIASVSTAAHDSAFFDFVIKKTTNVRSGTVYACHDGGSPTTLVAFTETSTQDLGDTSDVTLSVEISGNNMELRATTTSDNWSIKSLIRAI